MNGQIAFSRAKGWSRQDMFRAYTIVIDGTARGKLKRGRRQAFEVPPGSHTVRATINWCGSPEVPVEVTARQTVEFEVVGGGNPNVAFAEAAATEYLALVRRS
ncbi:MAG: hypothetical protein ACT4QG_10860 [Sporichthyaceae bacterium]